MPGFMIYVAVPIAIGIVAIILLLGLINMMRGGSPHQLSQRADAPARSVPVHRDRHYHADDLGDGPLSRSRWWSSTASILGPATTA